MSDLKTIYLKDYQPPNFGVDSIDLIFDIWEDKTIVHSTTKYRRNNTAFTVSKDKTPPLVLQGEKLILLDLILDGRPLSTTEYRLEPGQLIIENVPATFTLEVKTEIHPEKNTELMGLFRSKALYCTQCEPQGFRRMTYYPDRPDVMAKFTTKIIADKNKYPVLLSNGNCVDRGNVDLNRHWVKWEDPFLKPCYLYALVAGNLVAVEDTYVTMNGRLVTLKIYTEEENQDKCRHAMQALKKSMHWDEVTYGREYDLDIYMIVAVADFNMGAMENKGLNIFNSKYILARPETATDTDYQLIDAVVGHEYFHNWSGNRVTCRDWFQLSLKEGLTVFRDHQFSSDISGSPVALINNVRALRNHQFSEDASPMAHPVRPESYVEINNFYTTTVYEKGAELIRMIKTLLGPERFRKGMDLYFERHDGQAVTTDDFVAAMEAASNEDLSQFRLWYAQAGTPEIEVKTRFDENAKALELTLKQFCPPTPLQPTKAPMAIPISIGLLNPEGKDILPNNQVLVLKKETDIFSFPNIEKRPVISFLRNFSAPVKVHFEREDGELAFLLSHDSDDFNRWDAGQKLTENLIWRLVAAIEANEKLEAPKYWLDAYQAILEDKKLNPALKAELFTLPSLGYLIELKKPANIDALFAVRTFLKQRLSEICQPLLLEAYQNNLTPGRYQYQAVDVAKRSFKNTCLHYLSLTSDANQPGKGIALCMQQWKTANNMTDALGALSVLSNAESPERTQCLSEFLEEWRHDALVMDKWFKIQALAELPSTLDTVKTLMKHPEFDITNPNKVYSLIGGFCSGNLACFHDKSGAGYRFLSDVVLRLDPLNPQVAARMVRAFANWKQFDAGRQDKIRTEFKRMMDAKLSKDVLEIVSKCLAADA